MFIHEDARRRLIEWAEGEFKVCKVVIAESDCVVGDHYHLKKDEVPATFRALHQCNNRGSRDLRSKAAILFRRSRGIYHRFELERALCFSCGYREV